MIRTLIEQVAYFLIAVAVAILMVYAVAANAQAQVDFRYIPGEVKINFDNPTDIAWVYNQDLINKKWAGIAAGLHYRELHDSERKLMPNIPDGAKCIILPEAGKVNCWPNEFPDNMNPGLFHEIMTETCAVFNRDVVGYSDKVLTCGEPKSPSFDNVPKHKDQA